MQDGFDIADDGACSMGAVVFGPNGPVAECTLRAAIEEANRALTGDTIRFSNIPISSGCAIISPATPLPDITESVSIDGSTAPGYDTVDPFAVPIIQVNGAGALAGTSGLTLNSQSWGSSVNLKSIAIYSFGGDGIVVGGCSSQRGNVISASGGDGIHIEGATSKIVGNRIGTDRMEAEKRFKPPFPAPSPISNRYVTSVDEGKRPRFRDRMCRMHCEQRELSSGHPGRG